MLQPNHAFPIKRLLVFVLLSLALCWCVTIYAYRDFRQQSGAFAVEQQLHQTSTLLNQRLAALLSRMDAMLISPSTQAVVYGHSQSEQWTSLWVQHAQSLIGVERIALILPDGRIESVQDENGSFRYRGVADATAPDLFQGFELKHQYMQEGTWYLSSLFRAGEHGRSARSLGGADTAASKMRFSVARVVPTEVSSRAFTGVRKTPVAPAFLVVTVDVAALAQATWVEGAKSTAFITDRKGTQWAPLYAASKVQGSALEELPMSQMVNWIVSVPERDTLTYSHGDVIYGIADLSALRFSNVQPGEDFPWRLLERTDRSTVVASGFHAVWFLPLTGLLFASLVGLIAGLFLLWQRERNHAKVVGHQDSVIRDAEKLLTLVDEGLIVVDKHCKIVFSNEAAVGLLSTDGETLIGKNVQHVFPLQVNLAFFQQDFWRESQCQVSMPIRRPSERKQGQNSLRVIHFESMYLHDRYCIRCKDCTAMLEMESQLHFLQSFDALTQTMQRGSFEHHIDHKFRTASCKGTLYYVDVDDFRGVNCANSFMLGDAVLAELGKRLRQFVRKRGIVARTGADEFLIYTDDVLPPAALQNFLTKMLSALSDKIDSDTIKTRLIQPEKSLSGGTTENASASSFKRYALAQGALPNEPIRDIRVTASIGVARAPNDADNAAGLIVAAEEAMQAAKRAGGAQWAVYQAQEATDERFLDLSKELRRAIRKDQFELHYQPIFDLNKRKLLGFEALLRWQHDKRGLLMPNDFLAHLENSRMIVDVGYNMIRKACAFITEMNQQQRSPLYIAVNISPRQFTVKDFVANIQAILSETHCRPEWLALELSEGAVLHNIDSAALTLRQFRELGVKISIDDFGKGVASLDYLKKLDVDQIKIDKAFVTNAQTHNEDKATLEFTTFLAKKLNLAVVAEGVEAAETDKLLLDLGIHYGQGYFYARPMSQSVAEKYAAVLRDRIKARVVKPGKTPELRPPMFAGGEHIGGTQREKVVRFPTHDH